MFYSYPTEEELRNRINKQLSWRGPTDAVAILWRGYLNGIFEWGLIEVHVYEKLIQLLPKIGSVESSELFAGRQLTPEEEREVVEYMQK